VIKNGGKRERLVWVMANDERAMRSVMGIDGADEIGFGWIDLG